MEGARFCHMCGAPQRREDQALAAEDTSGPPLQGVPDAINHPPTRIKIEPIPVQEIHTTKAPVSLNNPLVVRSAAAAASLAVLGSAVVSLTGIPMLPLLVYIGAGYYTVWLYVRATGQRLEPGKGTLLGWICGAFVSLIQLIVMTIMFVVESPADVLQEFKTQMQEVMKAYPDQTPEMTQALDFLTSPTGMTIVIVASLILMTLPPALGGFIGARSVGRR